MHTIVLLGIGHTNAEFLLRWNRHPFQNTRLVAISLYPISTYSGMLPGVLANQFSTAEMTIDLEELTNLPHTQLVLGNVQDHDLKKRHLILTDNSTIEYDVLSIGVGSVPTGIPQSASPLIVAIKPMQTFLQRLDGRLAIVERSRVRVTVVGGGVTGIELAFCVHKYLKDANRESEITIVTSGPGIAHGLSPRSVRRLHNLLRRYAIRVMLNTRVVDGEENDFIRTVDGQKFECDIVLWTTGASPPSVVERLHLPLADDGFLATQRTLQCIGQERVFAVGDCATMLHGRVPKAGVFAVRQAPVLWRNIHSLLQGRKLQAYRPQRGFLKLLNTGDGRALLDYHGWTFHARWCWFLKAYIDRRFVHAYQK